MAKGFRGRSKNCYLIAKHRVEKSLQHAYVGRKLKKRNARKEWIVSLNAATREHGMNYSLFMNGLQNANVEINRKVLAELAKSEPFAFKSILLTAQSAVDPGRLKARNKNAVRKLYAIQEDKNDEDEGAKLENYTTMEKVLFS